MAALERCTNSLMFFMTRSTSSVPDTCVVSTPATRSSPSSEASASHVRGFSPRERSEPPLPRALIARFAWRTWEAGCS